MDASSLQNPSDPDATYRIKAGKEHRGYSANITETVDKNGSVVTDYQYDVNTRSDLTQVKNWQNWLRTRTSDFSRQVFAAENRARS